MKIIFRSIIVLAILALLILLGGNFLLNHYSDALVAKYLPRLEQKGIQITGMKYGTISIHGLRSVAIHDVDMDFKINKKLFLDKDFSASFKADAVIVRLASLGETAMSLSFRDFDIVVHDEEALENRFGKFEKARFASTMPIKITAPRASAKHMIAEMKRLFNENATEIPFRFEGDVVLSMEEKQARIHIYDVRRDGITSLRFSTEDVMEAARMLDTELVQAEAELIAHHPNRVPQMIKITRQAKGYAAGLHQQNENIPEDALRHVYWSYLLTKAFGPDFAKAITDARETEPGNTPAERQMDYTNNAAGQKYALAGVKEKDIVDKVLHAPEVTRYPR
jgi:hypothetical protein